MKLYKVTILWGTNGFGKWLADYALKHFSEYICLTTTGSKDNNIEAIKDADIVIYSVPISKTEEIMTETLPYIKAWAIVADVTSMKKFPSMVMQAREDIIVIPTHPMFGPYIEQISWQVVILTAEKKSQESPEYKFLKNFLEMQQAKVHECTPEYHDKMMAVVQGLTHFNMFVVWETMKRLGISVQDSLNFVSPIYKLMISSVGRYLGQNPKLYADIQMYNDEILPVHEAFLETAKNFHLSVQSKNIQKFCGDIEEARDFFGHDICQDWQEYTDMIIEMLSKQK